MRKGVLAACLVGVRRLGGVIGRRVGVDGRSAFSLSRGTNDCDAERLATSFTEASAVAARRACIDAPTVRPRLAGDAAPPPTSSLAARFAPAVPTTLSPTRVATPCSSPASFATIVSLPSFASCSVATKVRATSHRAVPRSVVSQPKGTNRQSPDASAPASVAANAIDSPSCCRSATRCHTVAAHACISNSGCSAACANLGAIARANASVASRVAPKAAAASVAVAWARIVAVTASSYVVVCADDDDDDDNNPGVAATGAGTLPCSSKSTRSAMPTMAAAAGCPAVAADDRDSSTSKPPPNSTSASPSASACSSASSARARRRVRVA
mmetsp:Transcript_1023/g.3129  ORF Transcript_1023/g.3129 Transcript_1023/m.3129 type:complete len:327 (-) Transcript_1023:1619-2599(-)